MKPETLRPLFWIASVRKDIRQMPAEVQDAFGYALYLAQTGGRHERAKSLRGFGSGILEVVEDSREGTFRAVYTVRFENEVYVLHCFQKKSTQGIVTPKMHLEVIKERLKVAEAHAKGRRID